jgi:hypothetical protein
VFDMPSHSLEAFVRHIARVNLFRSGRERPLVVLTKTAPVSLSISYTRRLLEPALPSLEQATWIGHVSSDAVETFSREAERDGFLSGELDSLPIWSAREGGHYVVSSRRALMLGVVGVRIEDCERLNQAAKSVRGMTPEAPPPEAERAPITPRATPGMIRRATPEPQAWIAPGEGPYRH